MDPVSPRTKRPREELTDTGLSAAHGRSKAKSAEEDEEDEEDAERGDETPPKGWAASGCGCTETCPVTRDRRASRRLHVPAGRSGRLRGARSLEDSLHRPLVRRAGWR